MSAAPKRDFSISAVDTSSTPGTSVTGDADELSAHDTTMHLNDPRFPLALFTAALTLTLTGCDSAPTELDREDEELRGGEVEPWLTPTLDYSGVVLLEARDDHSGTNVVAQAGDCAGAVAGVDTTDANGDFTLTVEPGQTYCLTAWPLDARFLTAHILWDAPAQADPIPPTTLPLGDVNEDGTIDVLDLSFVGGRYDCDDPVCDEPADLDEDGFVCDSDLAIIDANFGLAEPVAW